MDYVQPLGVPAVIGVLAVAFVVYSVLWWVGYERYEYADEQETMFEADCRAAGINLRMKPSTGGEATDVATQKDV